MLQYIALLRGINVGGHRVKMDEFRFSGTEVFWLIQGKLSESPLFSGGLEEVSRGASTTMRNMNTIRRLVSKTQQPS